MTKIYGSPFAIDWKDKDNVIAYAKKLGKGHIVFKHPSRDNYNITFVCRPDQYEGCEIIYKT